MANNEVLIKVDDEILQYLKDNGYEITEFRTPKVGEKVLSYMCYISTAAIGWNAPRPILKKKFVWPEWLKCRWIAKNVEGVWIAMTGSKAYIVDDRWWVEGFTGDRAILILDGAVDTSSFPDVPWQESLIENPNYGK